MDDEFMTLFVAQAQAQSSMAYVTLTEIRLTRALVYLTLGLFALVNNWPVVGILASVLAAGAAVMALMKR